MSEEKIVDVLYGYAETGGQPTPEAIVEAHNESMGLASEKTRYILTHPWRFHCGFILCDQSVGKSHVVVCCNDSHLADHVVALHNASLQAIVDKLPKCWRLLDGKLVQDVPVELDATLWKLDYKDEPVDVTVTGKKHYSDAEWWAVCSDFAYPVSELYDSREATEAAREKGDA